MASPVQYWTPEMVRELIDEERASPRYECIDGVLLVTPAPAPRHQRATTYLLVRLANYLSTWPKEAEVYASPSEIQFEDSLVQPDVFVLPVGDRPPKSWREVRALLLAVEVISPSSRVTDRTVKRRLYQRAGIPEYWVIDLDARHLERWRPQDSEPEIVTADLVWHPDPGLAPLTIDLEELFRAAD